MKKYLAAIAPFIICLILAIIYHNLKPVEDYTNPLYMYRSKGAIRYYTFMYVFIGAIISAILSCIMVIDDFFKLFETTFPKESTTKKLLPVATGLVICFITTLLVLFLFKALR